MASNLYYKCQPCALFNYRSLMWAAWCLPTMCTLGQKRSGWFFLNLKALGIGERERVCLFHVKLKKCQFIPFLLWLLTVLETLGKILWSWLATDYAFLHLRILTLFLILPNWLPHKLFVAVGKVLLWCCHQRDCDTVPPDMLLFTSSPSGPSLWV